ncbi:tyramine receptor Ser-2 [Nematostella vectensis]|uniref:tyramine receptor Ser-2 n=1 Tax=Nematostella vectensis TaxID=45351 RepID=UPI00207738B4|nr:tyramine receptor Ser-2 [Nematostella vectensis]
MTASNETSSLHSEPLSTGIIVFYCIIMASITITAIFGNSLVIAAVRRTRSLRTSSAILVVNLACVDLAVTIIIVPFVILTAANTSVWDETLPQEICKATGFMNAFLTAAQIMALLHISVNRFIAVAFPHSYEKLTKRFTMGTVFFGWLHSLFWTLMPFLGWGELGFVKGTLFCNILWSQELSFAVTVQVVCYFLPTAVAVILYIGIYVNVRRQSKRVKERSRSTLSMGDISCVTPSRPLSGVSISSGEYPSVTQPGVTESGVTPLGESRQTGVEVDEASCCDGTKHENTNVTQTKVKLSGVTHSEIVQSDVTQSEVTQPNVTQSGVTHSKIVHSDVAQSEVTQPNVTQSGVTQSNVKQSEVTQSDLTQSNAAQSVVTQSDITQSGLTQSDVTQSGEAEFGVTHSEGKDNAGASLESTENLSHESVASSSREGGIEEAVESESCKHNGTASTKRTKRRSVFIDAFEIGRNGINGWYERARKAANGDTGEHAEGRPQNGINRLFKRQDTSDTLGKSLTSMKKEMTEAERAEKMRNKRRKILENRVTRTLLGVALAFAVCWFPRGVANLWALFAGRESVPRGLEYASTAFVFMNSSVNPILYGALHQDFNRAFRDILYCRTRVRRARSKSEDFSASVSMRPRV